MLTRLLRPIEAITIHVYSKTGVYRSTCIQKNSIFALKHRLWILLHTHNICFKQNKKMFTRFHIKHLSILQIRVFTYYGVQRRMISVDKQRALGHM